MLLKFAIKEFADDREFKNVSKETLKSYLGVLNEFHSYSSNQEIINVNDISSSVVKSYLLYCQRERKNNPTSINTKLKRLRVFFNYLEDEGIITTKENPTKKIKPVKADVKIEVFQEKHIRQMLSYYRRLKTREKTFYAYRDYTMIVFLLGTGVRLGELINLTWNDVDLINGKIIVVGKKRQQSSIPITDKLIKELCEYKIYCKQYMDEELKFVFTDNESNQLTSNAVKCIFKRLREAMDFNDVRLSAHTFRHTFAHHMLINGCDVFTIQKMLRHSDLSMTKRYLAIWGTALKEQNDKFNPLNNIDI